MKTATITISISIRFPISVIKSWGTFLQAGMKAIRLKVRIGVGGEYGSMKMKMQAGTHPVKIKDH